MANQSDSFIDEVTADLRRDRLYQGMRRFGWVVVLLIVVIVGGTAWLEYSRIQSREDARAFGDAVMAARQDASPAEALAAIDPAGSTGRRAIAGLLAAGVMNTEGQEAKAAQDLRALAAEIGSADPVLRDLAKLKAVIAAGPSLGMSDRDAILDELSQPGAPFELLALEQKAIALVGAGRDEDAIVLIRQIQQKADLSEGLRRRLGEMMITLGAPPDAGGPLAGNDAQTPPRN